MKLALERFIPNIILVFLFEDGRNHGFWIWLGLISTVLCFGRVFFGFVEGLDVNAWMIMMLVVGTGFTGTNLLKIWMGAKFGEPGLKAIDKADGTKPAADAPAA